MPTMNISGQNISGKCNFKCAYSFNYQESNCYIQNSGNFLSIKYDKSSTPSVIFNNDKYDIQYIQIYSPSLHNYNGSPADGEIIMTHTSNTGSTLTVVVPISSQSGTQTNGSSIIQDIVYAASNGAANQGESTQVKINNFTLNNIVPMKPFFSYSFNESNDVIVYGIENAISVNKQTTDNLSKIIVPSGPVSSGPHLFINSEGPNNNNVNDGQIYIDCQPTGNSEENIDVEHVKFNKLKAATTFDAKDILNNPIFLLFVCSLLFIVFLLVFNYGIVFLSKANSFSFKNTASSTKTN